MQLTANLYSYQKRKPSELFKRRISRYHTKFFKSSLVMSDEIVFERQIWENVLTNSK